MQSPVGATSPDRGRLPPRPRDDRPRPLLASVSSGVRGETTAARTMFGPHQGYEQPGPQPMGIRLSDPIEPSGEYHVAVPSRPRCSRLGSRSASALFDSLSSIPTTRTRLLLRRDRSNRPVRPNRYIPLSVVKLRPHDRDRVHDNTVSGLDPPIARTSQVDRLFVRRRRVRPVASVFIG